MEKSREGLRIEGAEHRRGGKERYTYAMPTQRRVGPVAGPGSALRCIVATAQVVEPAASVNFECSTWYYLCPSHAQIRRCIFTLLSVSYTFTDHTFYFCFLSSCGIQAALVLVSLFKRNVEAACSALQTIILRGYRQRYRSTVSSRLSCSAS